MAGIDLLSVLGKNAPSPPAPQDSGTKPPAGSGDANGASFGSVLNDTLKPAATKENTTKPREKSPTPGNRTAPQRAADSPTTRSTPKDSKRQRTTDAKDSSPAPSPAPSSRSQDSNKSEEVESTVEAEVASTDASEQATDQNQTAPAPQPTPTPAPSAAPAQLVAGLLLASAQPSAANTVTPATSKSPSTATDSVTAAQNAQKPPAGLMAALEQANPLPESTQQKDTAEAPQPQQPVSTILADQASGGETGSPAANSAPVTPAATQAPTPPPPAVDLPKVKEPEAKATDSLVDKLTPPEDDGSSQKAPAQDPQGAKSQTNAAPPKVETTSNGDVQPQVSLMHSQAVPQDAEAAAPKVTSSDDPKDGGKLRSTSSETRKSDASTSDSALATVDSAITGILGAKSNDGNGSGKSFDGSSDGSAAPSTAVDDGPQAPESGSSPNGLPVDPSSARKTGGTQTITRVAAEQTVHSSQVVSQVAHGIQVAHQTGDRMQLHLQPPDLGNVQIDVSMRDGLLSARIEAQTPSTHQLLTDNLPQLKESLTQQGLQVDRLEVDLSDSMRDGGTGGGSTGRPFDQQQNANQDGTWEPVAPTAPAARRATAPDVRSSPVRSAAGSIMSLDITV